MTGTIIGSMTLTGALAVFAYRDWKEQKVSLYGTVLLAVLGIVYHIIWQEQTLWSMFAGALIGVFFLALSWFTKECVGTGDGALLAATGIYLGFWDNLRLVCFALFFAAFAAGYLLLVKKKRRKDRIPFIPFLFAANLLLLLCGKCGEVLP